MESAYRGSDADGAWDWKTAYDSCEAATILFLRKFGPAMRARAASPAALLPMLAKIAGLLPTHTRRSEESQALQQFSTPIALGLAASAAAAITPADLVLEPSAGTGLLAIFAELAGESLVLNELAETRAGLLGHLFPGIAVTRFDAAHIDDHLDTSVTPSVVLMNPPFSAVAHVDRRMADAALRHISSALARLADGGRLVAITGASFAPDNPAWTDAFAHFQERGQIVFSAAIDGSVYAKHGTTIDTRLTVIDKRPDEDQSVFPASPGIAPDAATLLAWVTAAIPPRLPLAAAMTAPTPARPIVSRTVRPSVARPSSVPARTPEVPTIELAYETVDWKPVEGGRITDALYEEYGLQSIRISGSQAHPTRLVQSAAMASVAPPKPSYRPHLAPNVVPDGLLSDAHSKASSKPGRPIAATSPDRGRWTRPSTSSRPRPMTLRMPSGSAAAGSWATAPAPARAARSPAFCSIIGSRVVAAPFGCRSPTSCWRTPSAIGRRWARSACWSRRCRVSVRELRSGWSRVSFLRPMPRYAPTRVTRRFRASARSSNGWAPISTE